MQSVRWLTRDCLLRVARDETGAAAARSALVLAPHPDDETLGCGATILRKVAAGAEVTVAVLTDGRYSYRGPCLTPDELAILRHGEMTEAAKRLCLPAGGLRWAGFEDGSLDRQEARLLAFVEALVEELAPEEVYATCAQEWHPDHAALGRVARAAVLRAGPRTRLLEYPVWLWNSWPLAPGARTRSIVDAAGRLLRRRVTKVRCGIYRAAKLHALDAHSSQLRRPVGVPAGDWPTLPHRLVTAAHGDAELFFPWQPMDVMARNPVDTADGRLR